MLRHSFVLKVFMIVALCYTNVTLAQFEGRVVDGTAIAAGTDLLKHMVSLQEDGRHFCGGTLITNQHVLTAAHCLNKKGTWDLLKLSVMAGDMNLTASGDRASIRSRISRVFIHPNFNSRSLNNDIAILELSKPVRMNKNISTVAVAGFDVNENEAVVVAGWGRIDDYADPSVKQPLEASVPVMSNSNCQTLYKGISTITSNMVCAGAQYASDACYGDSGGPLFINHNGVIKQVGVVSFGVGCGDFHPGVYARTYPQLGWIDYILSRFGEHD